MFIFPHSWCQIRDYVNFYLFLEHKCPVIMINKTKHIFWNPVIITIFVLHFPHILFISSADSPVLWLRLDPDMTLMRAVEVEQPDNQWQYQLRHERDVTAQTEAINALLRLAKQGMISCSCFCICHLDNNITNNTTTKVTFRWLPQHTVFSLLLVFRGLWRGSL